MYIAATAVSMEAARSSREMEQQALAMLPVSAGSMQPGAADDFGLRLASQISSTTAVLAASCSVVSQAHDPCITPHAVKHQDATNDAIAWDRAISQLAAQVVGQPVAITAKEEASPPAGTAASNQPASLPVQMVQLTSVTSYRQEETQLFSAQGQVQTTDGREIAFDFGLSLHRETTVVNTTSLGLTAALVDPLLLQFDLDAPLLTDTSFLFDLNSDGEGENLACPGQGCGFLAFDRNGDGRINNGMELFGPASGSGFGELAEFDSDANAWIDEGDPIFDQLLVWRPNGQGGEELTPLRQAGVGAIAVVHAGTEFQLQNTSGSVLGVVKGSGIFLTEAGEVRSLQEIDLAMPSEQADNAAPDSGQPDASTREALQALRTIIGLQRLRLSLMLTGERLADRLRALEAESGPRELLSSWWTDRGSWSFMTDLDNGTRASQPGAAEQPAGDAVLTQEAEWLRSGRTMFDAPWPDRPAGMAAMLARIVQIGERR